MLKCYSAIVIFDKNFLLSIIATLFFTAVNDSEIGTTNLCNIEPLEPVVTISIQ